MGKHKGLIGVSIGDVHDRVLGCGGTTVFMQTLGLLGLILILVFGGIHWSSGGDHHDIKKNVAECFDGNPCHGDTAYEKECVRDTTKKNGYNCSDWVCLAPNSTATCEWKKHLGDSFCVATGPFDCPGTCTSINGFECPDLYFKPGVLEEFKNCQDGICVNTIDISNQTGPDALGCDENDPKFIDLCNCWLDEEDFYGANQCLCPKPICSIHPEAENTKILTGCTFTMECAKMAPNFDPILVVRDEPNEPNNKKRGLPNSRAAAHRRSTRNN